MRRGGSGSRLGEMLQEQLTEMLGLSHRRGKFPDYLSFEQLKQTRNAWNKVICCGDNWSSDSENRFESLHQIKY